MSCLIILGNGPEINYLLENHTKELNIKAYGFDVRYHNSQDIAINYCENNNIDIIENLYELEKYNNPIIFMCSYPPLISMELLCKFNFINMHGALLPRFRGLHGGTWAIINGENKMGYTIHEVDSGIDSGPIYYQGILDIGINENIHSIREMMFEHYKKNILYVLKNIIEGNLKAKPQDESQATFVCKRRPEDGKINWDMNALDVHNLIRALTPPYTPGAFTFYKNEPLYIVDSEIQKYPNYIGINGQVVNKFEGKGVLVKCNDTVLLIKNIIYKDEIINAFDLFKTVGARLG